jgi:hypothetical protein
MSERVTQLPRPLGTVNYVREKDAFFGFVQVRESWGVPILTRLCDIQRHIRFKFTFMWYSTLAGKYQYVKLLDWSSFYMVVCMYCTILS